MESTDGGNDWRQCMGTIVGAPTSGVGALPTHVYGLQSPAQVLAEGGSVFLTYYGRDYLEVGGAPGEVLGRLAEPMTATIA